MSGKNKSGGTNRNYWRNDAREFNAYRNHILANTICCTRTDCNKEKVELVPEHVCPREQNVVYPLLSTTYPPGREPPSDKKNKNKSKGPAEQYNPVYPAYCPCVVNQPQLVTYCCVRQDCDDASKIGDEVRECPAYNQFKF